MGPWLSLLSDQNVFFQTKAEFCALSTQAKQLCAARGLGGEFLKTCAHDTTYSGDDVFVDSTFTAAKAFNFTRSSLNSSNRSGSSSASMSSVAAASLLGCALLLALLV